MRRLAVLLLATLALPAAALDGIPHVKSTPVLKSTTSWDGQALAYPAGQAEARTRVLSDLGIYLIPGLWKLLITS